MKLFCYGTEKMESNVGTMGCCFSVSLPYITRPTLIFEIFQNMSLWEKKKCLLPIANFALPRERPKAVLGTSFLN